MKPKAIYTTAGYADLWPLRILVTIFILLALVAIPSYSEYLKHTKLISVLDDLQLAVDEHYKETRQLPDLEKITVVAKHEHVDTKNRQLRINLSLIDKDVADQYLLLKPFLEGDNVAWKCAFVGNIYKDDIPDLRDNICQASRLALEQRSFAERAWIFTKSISNIVLGYILFIVFTFLVG